MLTHLRDHHELESNTYTSLQEKKDQLINNEKL